MMVHINNIFTPSVRVLPRCLLALSRFASRQPRHLL